MSEEVLQKTREQLQRMILTAGQLEEAFAALRASPGAVAGTIRRKELEQMFKLHQEDLAKLDKRGPLLNGCKIPAEAVRHVDESTSGLSTWQSQRANDQLQRFQKHSKEIRQRALPFLAISRRLEARGWTRPRAGGAAGSKGSEATPVSESPQVATPASPHIQQKITSSSGAAPSPLAEASASAAPPGANRVQPELQVAAGDPPRLLLRITSSPPEPSLAADPEPSANTAHPGHVSTLKPVREPPASLPDEPAASTEPRVEAGLLSFPEGGPWPFPSHACGEKADPPHLQAALLGSERPA